MLSKFADGTKICGVGGTRGKGWHPEGTWQASGMVPSENHNVQQGQVEGPAPGMKKTPVSVHTEG